MKDFDEVPKEGVVGATRVPLRGNGDGSSHAINEAQGRGGTCRVNFLRDFQPWRRARAFSFLTSHFSVFFQQPSDFCLTTLYIQMAFISIIKY